MKTKKNIGFPVMSGILLAGAVFIGAVTAFGQAAIPKHNEDIGALQQPFVKGAVKIVPLPVDTTRPPQGLTDSVTIFADFLPFIYYGAPQIKLDNNLASVRSGWYMAQVSIDDPWWVADPVDVPVYIDAAGLPVVSFEHSRSEVNILNAGATVSVSATHGFTGKVAFDMTNIPGVTCQPADQVLDFSNGQPQTIRISWSNSGKETPPPGTIRLMLDPQGSEPFIAQTITHDLVLIPDVVILSSPTDYPGFTEKSALVPVSLPYTFIMTPCDVPVVISMKVAGGVQGKDFALTWDPAMTSISAASTGELRFHIPANIVPKFTLQVNDGAEPFVAPGTKRKPLTLSLLSAAQVDDGGNEVASLKVRHNRLVLNFFNAAPLARDDNYAIRSVIVHLKQEIQFPVLANDESPGAAPHIASVVGADDRVSVSNDSSYIVYTIPEWDSRHGFTDSFTYTIRNVDGVSQPARIYVTVGDARTRGDSVYYTAEEITHTPNLANLTRKPAFYGMYTPLGKTKLKRIGIRNFKYVKNGEGANAMLSSNVVLLNKKLRKSPSYRQMFFADIGDTVQTHELGLQLFTRVPKSKEGSPLASWVIVPPQPDTYRIVTDLKGRRYALVDCRYEGDKPKAFFEFKRAGNDKLFRRSARIVRKPLVIDDNTTLVPTPGFMIALLPTLPTETVRADFIIDSRNGQGFIRDFNFDVTSPTGVEPNFPEAALFTVQ